MTGLRAWAISRTLGSLFGSAMREGQSKLPGEMAERKKQEQKQKQIQGSLHYALRASVEMTDFGRVGTIAMITRRRWLRSRGRVVVKDLGRVGGEGLGGVGGVGDEEDLFAFGGSEGYVWEGAEALESMRTEPGRTNFEMWARV